MAKEDSKLAIYDAAKALFCTKGYAGTSIRDIATKANVNHAIIRYHYGSKKELWLRVVSGLISEGVGLREKFPFKPDLTNRETITKSVRDFIRIRVAHYLDNPEFIKIIYLNTIEGGERFAQMDALLRHAYIGTRKILTKMIETGVIKDIDFTDLYFILPTFTGSRFIFPNYDIDMDGKKMKREEIIDRHTNLLVQLLIK